MTNSREGGPPPWGGERPQTPGQPGSISVGGPGGIRIEGGQVHISGGPGMGSYGAPQPPYGAVQPYGATERPPPGAMVHSSDLRHATGLVKRHPRAVAAGLAVSAVTLLSGATAVVSVLELPWLVMAAPVALALALVTVAAALLVRAGRQATTGGLDPDTEQRLLDVAFACRGRVTVTAAARGLGIPLAEAESALGTLARSGHVAFDNDPATGVVVYVFPDIEAGLVPPRRLP